MIRSISSFVTLCFISLPLVAISAEIEPGKDWRNCSKDDQCVLIDGLCNKTSVNWQVKAQAEAYYAQQREKVRCKQNFWTPSERVARCHLGGCDTRPVQANDAAAQK